MNILSSEDELHSLCKEINKVMARNLRQLRLESNLSVTELARKVGCSPATISSIETAKKCLVNPTVVAFCYVHRLCMTTLFCGEEDASHHDKAKEESLQMISEEAELRRAYRRIIEHTRATLVKMQYDFDRSKKESLE